MTVGNGLFQHRRWLHIPLSRESRHGPIVLGTMYFYGLPRERLIYLCALFIPVIFPDIDPVPANNERYTHEKHDKNAGSDMCSVHYFHFMKSDS